MNYTKIESEPFIDNELDDVKKDIDTKIDFLHEKVIKDLIRVRLFQTKKTLLEQYSVNDQNVSMTNQIENNDDIEIKQLSDKNMELEQLLDSKRDQLDLIQRTQDSIANDIQNTIADLKNNCKKYDEYIANLKNEILATKTEEKKKLMNDNKAETDTLNSKNDLISRILQLRIEIIQNNIIFRFKSKYSVKLTKDANNINKITDWNSKSYKLSISDRNKLEKEFNNMDLKSWIINVREMLIQ